MLLKIAKHLTKAPVCIKETLHLNYYLELQLRASLEVFQVGVVILSFSDWLLLYIPREKINCRPIDNLDNRF